MGRSSVENEPFPHNFSPAEYRLLGSRETYEGWITSVLSRPTIYVLKSKPFEVFPTK
jgi:hypothetical protein